MYRASRSRRSASSDGTARARSSAGSAESSSNWPCIYATIGKQNVDADAGFDRSKDWVGIEAVGHTRSGELNRPYITGWLDWFLMAALREPR